MATLSSIMPSLSSFSQEAALEHILHVRARRRTPWHREVRREKKTKEKGMDKFLATLPADLAGKFTALCNELTNNKD